MSAACRPDHLEVVEDYFAAQHQDDPRPLEESCYPSFAHLIRDCQTYASLSGCRFSIAAFDGIDCDKNRVPVVSDKRSQDAGPLLSAKLRAAPTVREFKKRLRKGDERLATDLTRAFHSVMKETARNSMIAHCKAEDFFPPLPAPRGVDDEDCNWDEVGLASAPVIAQRLYNDEARRLLEPQALVYAKTSSFIVEFADEIGVALPKLPAERTNMLQQFQKDLASWTSSSSEAVSGEDSPTCQSRSSFDARDTLLMGTTAVAVVGLLGGLAASRVVQSSTRLTPTRGILAKFGHRMQV